MYSIWALCGVLCGALLAPYWLPIDPLGPEARQEAPRHAQAGLEEAHRNSALLRHTFICFIHPRNDPNVTLNIQSTGVVDREFI